MIPLADLTAQHRLLQKELWGVFHLTLTSGNFIDGTALTKFEQSFAAYCGRRHCVGVGSGTGALTAALFALGIRPGDEVIVPALTFVSTAFAVLAIGATPVIVDVDPVSLTLDPKLLPAALTKRTRAVIPVHLYGLPADMRRINACAKKHKLFVVEDAAQAVGSTYRGKPAGSLGTIGCFSFYPSKNLGAMGDGGAIVTDSKRIATKIREYCNVGQKRKYLHTVIGVNSRLDALQASILSVKLRYIDQWNKARRSHATSYATLLQHVPIQLPPVIENSISNNHLYVIRTTERTLLRAYLAGKGIATGIHYPLPIHLQPALRFLGYTRGSFPVSEQAANEVLSLPLYPELTQADIRRVAGLIRRFYRQR